MSVSTTSQFETHVHAYKNIDYASIYLFDQIIYF